MGLFDFLKGKDKKEESKEVKLFSPVNGTVIAIEEVADPVFSQKMMGDGFAVKPSDGNIYSPVSGKVVSVFPTQHAVGITMDNGIEVLVHMGLDTVELDGKPFNTVAIEGQEVTPETKLSTIDLKGLAEADKDDAIVVVFTNMDQVSEYSLSKTGQVSVNDEIGTVSGK